jgi:hypothetical protein
MLSCQMNGAVEGIAGQRARCRLGIVALMEFATVPDQRCTVSRRTASGKHVFRAGFAQAAQLCAGEANKES